MQNTRVENKGDLLIVDDLADNLRILSNTLSSQGYRVRAVKNGTMALVGAKAAPPDVVLLDIRMPGMDGYEVCCQFKADPHLCEIPIIFLSALDEMEDKAKAFSLGGADYITKPFQTEEVLARVKNQLTIQNLKKQVAKQKQQLEQIAVALPAILESSTRLCQNPALDPEQTAAIEVIQHNSRILLNLVNT